MDLLKIIKLIKNKIVQLVININLNNNKRKKTKTPNKKINEKIRKNN